MVEPNSLAWLATVHSLFLFGAEGIAIVSNTILMYLILTERTKIYNDHQRALLLNCIVDYLCSLLNIFIHPHYEIIDGQWIFILHKPLIYFSKNWQIFFIGFYAFTNCNKKLNIIELMGLAGISLFFSIICLFSFSYSFYVSQGEAFKAQELIDSGLVDLNNGIIQLVNAESKTPSMVLINFLIIVLKTAVFAAVIYLSYQIYDKLKIPGMSPKTQKLQANMNRMLLIQTSLTFVFAIFPAPFMIFFEATKITLLGSGTLITIVFVFVPVINPLCTLLLVGQFRRRFFSIVRIRITFATSTDHVDTIRSGGDPPKVSSFVEL